MWINYQFTAVCPLILNCLHISSQKWIVFANHFGLPNFLPQLPNFFIRIYPSYPWHFPTLRISWRNFFNINLKSFVIFLCWINLRKLCIYHYFWKQPDQFKLIQFLIFWLENWLLSSKSHNFEEWLAQFNVLNVGLRSASDTQWMHSSTIRNYIL